VSSRKGDQGYAGSGEGKGRKKKKTPSGATSRREGGGRDFSKRGGEGSDQGRKNHLAADLKYLISWQGGEKTREFRWRERGGEKNTDLEEEKEYGAATLWKMNVLSGKKRALNSTRREKSNRRPRGSPLLLIKERKGSGRHGGRGGGKNDTERHKRGLRTLSERGLFGRKEGEKSSHEEKQEKKRRGEQ